MTRRARFALSASLLLLALLAAGGAGGAYYRHLRSLPRIFEVSTGPVLQLHFNERADRLVVVSSVNETTPLRVVDVESGHETFGVPNLSDLVYGLAFSDDGELLACCTGFASPRTDPPGSLEVWSVRDARRLGAWPVTSTRGIAFTPDGRRLFEGQEPKAIAIRDVATGAITTTIPVEERFHSLQRAGSDFLLLARIDAAAHLEVRAVASGRHVAYLDGVENANPAVSPSCALFALRGDTPRKIVVRSVPSGTTVRTIELDGDLGTVGLSPDGTRFACITLLEGGASCVELFALEDGKRIRRFAFDHEKPKAVAFTRAADRLAIGMVSGRVEIHSLER